MTGGGEAGETEVRHRVDESGVRQRIEKQQQQ